jgi:hemerythrin-like domain-containing protein
MIRSYADRFHHAKEEDILFKYFDTESAILKAMFEDHTRARGYVKAVLAALDRNDQTAVSEGLQAYRELLSEHIRKEDEILYPWMDSELSESQAADLLQRFNAADTQIDVSAQKYIDLIARLEDRYNS